MLADHPKPVSLPLLTGTNMNEEIPIPFVGNVTVDTTTEKTPHIFIATPCYGGMCTGFYTQSLIQAVNILKANGIEMSVSLLFNESLIQRGRNLLAHQFMMNDSATHLMFSDADIKFNPIDIVLMLKANKDIICGVYPKKEINWNAVEKAVKDGVPVDQLKNKTGSLVVNLVGYEGEVTVPAGEPLEIWNGGTGFMLIKKEVMSKLKDVMPTYVNDVNVNNRDKITEYFACAIEPGLDRLLSEDYYFCWKARENGIKIHAAPWVNLGHVGNYLFEGGLMPNAS